MKEKNKGLAVGAAVGAVIGVITGILFAPKSGKETRQDIKDAAGRAQEKLAAESGKLQDELSRLVDKGEAKVKEAGGRANEAVVTAKKALRNLSDKTKAAKDGEDPDLKEALSKAKEARSAIAKFLKK